MAQQTINVGTAPNDGTGTPLRTAFQYTNSNFSELYTAVGPSGNNIVVPGTATITGDLTVDTNVLKVDTLNNRVGVLTATPGYPLHVNGTDATNVLFNGATKGVRFVASASKYSITGVDNTGAATFQPLAIGGASLEFQIGSTTHFSIDASGNATWSNVGGVAGTAMTLNSTGLGVGVASPSAKLHISGNLKIDGATSEILMATGAERTISASGSSGATALTFKRWDGVSAYVSDVIFNGSGNVGIGVTPSAWSSGIKILEFGTKGGLAGSGSDVNLIYNAYYDGSNKYRTSDYANNFQISGGQFKWLTAPSGTAGNVITYTQAMTLDASGNLLVGSALPVSGGRISGNSSTGPAGRFFSSAGDNQFAAMFDKSSATNTTSQWLIGFTINNQATGSGQINANGASQAAFGTFSDSRLKENIVSLPSQLANILSLRPVEFDYKDGSGHQIGFVAQEMQEVYSDAVGEQNGFLTVTGWSKTEARLVSAIKELAAKVQALEAKLA